MNNLNHREMFQEATKEKYRGSYTINSRTDPRYPEAAEREFRRINRAYMKIVREALQAHLPEILAAYKEGLQRDSRSDALFGMSDTIRQAMQTVTKKVRNAMQKVAQDVEQRVYDFRLERRIDKIANQTNLVALEEWRRTVKNTFGVDIQQDYYKSENYANTLRRWAADSVLKVKSIPTGTIQKIELTVLDGFREGKDLQQIQKEIQSSFNIDKRKAELLARDQISSLNAEITKMQQTDAGISRYRWRSCRDSLVRECHAALDGKVFSWDDPPEMWYRTKHGVVHTGRRCHPGEDYACRCIAVPVFDYQSTDIPIENERGE